MLKICPDLHQRASASEYSVHWGIPATLHSCEPTERERSAQMALLVNGRYIDDAMLAVEAARIRPALRAAMRGEPDAEIEARILEWARENVIDRALLEEAAFKDNQSVDPNVLEATMAEIEAARPQCILPGSTSVPREETRREIETELRVQRFVKEITKDEQPPNEDDVAAFYSEHAERFSVPERIHVAHIVKNVDGKTSERKAHEQIQQIAIQLHRGASFEELADGSSDCPGSGGDLGWIAPGEMVDDFERVAFSLAPGEVSRSFRSVFGFHIVKVYEKRPAELRPLSDVREEIEKQLLEDRKQRAFDGFLDALRKDAHVEEVSRSVF
jgi:parvulin-like peptidyl-prolyl isomerase